MNVATAFQTIRGSGSPPALQSIDVRSTSEYAAGHIPGTVNIPMDQVEARLDDLLPGVPILLVCQAGKRATMVAKLLECSRDDVTVLEGGTAAWSAVGLPLVTTSKSRFSLERQVRLIAGLLVLLSVLLSQTVHPRWIYLAALVGAGLTFAGLTDICMMAGLLTRMPWNQPRTKNCAVPPKACDCDGGHGARDATLK